MPKLVCVSCHRQIYTVAPLKALFLEERYCTRCGTEMITDRRGSGESRAEGAPPPAGPPPGVPDRRAGRRR